MPLLILTTYCLHTSCCQGRWRSCDDATELNCRFPIRC